MARPLTEKPEVDLTKPRRQVLYAMQDRIAAVPPAILELLEEESDDESDEPRKEADAADDEPTDSSGDAAGGESA